MINGLCDCLVCVPGLCEEMSHKPSLHTNHPLTQTIYHSLFYMLSGMCEGIVCVTSLHTNSLSLSVHPPVSLWLPPVPVLWLLPCAVTVVLSPSTPQSPDLTIPLYYIPSHNPSFHTNYPFTQTIYHSLYYILFGSCDYLVCVNKCKPFINICITSLHTDHPFTQTLYHSLYYILSGWCEGI